MFGQLAMFVEVINTTSRSRNAKGECLFLIASKGYEKVKCGQGKAQLNFIYIFASPAKRAEFRISHGR
jgi:hypothetical protein